MKFRLWSDVHCEFGEPSLNFTPDDKDTILIIAGDWGTGHDPFDGLMHQLCLHFKRVIFLAGNHDYWYSSILAVDTFWMDFRNNHKNFDYLSTGFHCLKMDDHRWIVGATLWTDCNNDKPGSLEHVRNYMKPDFKLIEEFNLYPYNWIYLHKNQRDYLVNNIKEIRTEDPDAKILMVTHHAPHAACDPDHSFNAGFCCTDMDPLIDPELVHTWAFGHTHVPVDFELNGVRMINNGRGYKGMEAIASDYETYSLDSTIYEV